MKLSYGVDPVLVAGGSGGIGSAIVARLADAGLPVAFTYHQQAEAAERLVHSRTDGATVRCYPWDGAQAEEAKKLVERVSEDVGPVRSLVVATGIAQGAAFHALAEDDWNVLIETNLTAAVSLARAVITPMMKAGHGRIVFLSSVAARRGLQGMTVYSATKAALEGLTRSLAREVASFGVTVNSVAPGFIETPMLDAMPDRVRREWTRRIPLGRMGSPDDVAAVVAYLMSNEAAYVTGQTWVVDGGLSL